MTVFVGGRFVVLGFPLVGPGGTIAFGPFATRDEAQRWLDDRPDVVAGAAIAELFDATGREHDDATQFVINYPATRPPVRREHVYPQSAAQCGAGHMGGQRGGYTCVLSSGHDGEHYAAGVKW